MCAAGMEETEDRIELLSMVLEADNLLKVVVEEEHVLLQSKHEVHELTLH